MLKAQNWQTVYSDRVQYFDSGINAIKIISSSVDGNGDSIFINYTSLYLDNTFIPSVTGDSVSWIGKRLIISANGHNSFLHTLNDTCVIKTRAGNSESWNFINNDSTLILAHIDSVSFGTYNGITDSVKHISLQVIKTPKNHSQFFTYLHNSTIWLSKHNGLLRMPVLEFNLAGKNPYYAVSQSTYNQTKENVFTNKNMFAFDVGDIIQSHVRSNYLYTAYQSGVWGEIRRTDEYLQKYYDSIGDSVTYTIKRKQYLITYEGSPKMYHTKNDTSYIYTKTYYNLGGQAYGLMPLSMTNFFTETYGRQHFGPSLFGFVKFGKCNYPVINQVDIVGGVTKMRLSCFSKIGTTYNYLDDFTGYSISEDVDYFKNSCDEFGNFLSTQTKKIDLPVKIFPNPVANSVTISVDGLQTVKMYDVAGRQISIDFWVDGNDAIADLSALSNGVYIILIETETAQITHKLVVQH